jgi:hypothetical protein
MYIDTNAVPEDFNAQDFIKKWSQSNKAAVVMDPTKVINGSSTTTTTGNGFWNQLNTGSANTYPFTDPLEDRVTEIEKQMNHLKLENTLLRLKMLSIEGKFTQDEIANIRKMLMSEDEASKTLANTIIENA